MYNGRVIHAMCKVWIKNGCHRVLSTKFPRVVNVLCRPDAIAMETFISVERARALIFENVPRCGEQVVPIDESLGYPLADDIISRDEIPPFASSAMDGFAVRTADIVRVPVCLRVEGEIPAGVPAERPVVTGACLRIMTGAPIPPGADAVVPVEWTRSERPDEVMIDRIPEPGQNIRPAGQDVQKGARVLESGWRITPPVIGMLATLGFGQVRVHIPPRVAVVATGDELVGPGEPLLAGKIRNSSGSALRAQAVDVGASVLPPLLARDNPESIREVVSRALDADVLIFAGGVSVGDYDLVKQVLDEMGMTLLFWKVRQRPGKPLAFGTLSGKPVFGLPGNPVSSAMCFEQYVRPTLAAMLGRRERLRPRHPAILLDETPKVKGLHFFARGVAEQMPDGRLGVRDTGPQSSNLYSSVVRANCIIHIEEAVEEAPAGTPVEIEWLPWAVV